MRKWKQLNNKRLDGKKSLTNEFLTELNVIQYQTLAKLTGPMKNVSCYKIKFQTTLKKLKNSNFF